MSGEGWTWELPRFLSQSHHVGHLYTEQPWRHHIHCTMYVSLTLLRTQCWEVGNEGVEQTEEQWTSRPLCVGWDIAAHSWLCRPTTHTDLESRGCRAQPTSQAAERRSLFWKAFLGQKVLFERKRKTDHCFIKLVFWKHHVAAPERQGLLLIFIPLQDRPRVDSDVKSDHFLKYPTLCNTANFQYNSFH